MSNTLETIKHYLPLCWFSAHPLDVPRSPTFFKHNLWYYFAVEMFIQINMIEDIDAMFEVTLETALTLSFAYVILLINRTTHSYLQVTTSILFCENVVATFIVPSMVWLTISDNELSYLLVFLLFVWDLSLVGFVCKKSLGINTLASAVIAVVYFIYTYGLSYGITTWVMG